MESSSLTAALLEKEAKAVAALARSTDRITSALTFVETRRAIHRAVFDKRITAKAQEAAFRKLDAFAESCTIIEMTPAILDRAGESFPIHPVRTLDAIHLATLLIAGPQGILSNDHRVNQNASALGYALA